LLTRREMPIYEYKCNNCGRVQEFLVLNNQKQDIICPNCGSKDMERVLSPTTFSFRTSTRLPGRTCCGREERCESPPCETGGICRRNKF